MNVKFYIHYLEKKLPVQIQGYSYSFDTAESKHENQIAPSPTTVKKKGLTLYLLTWRIWWAPNNGSKGQMGFNSAFKGLNQNIMFAIKKHTGF